LIAAVIALVQQDKTLFCALSAQMKSSLYYVYEKCPNPAPASKVFISADYNN